MTTSTCNTLQNGRWFTIRAVVRIPMNSARLENMVPQTNVDEKLRLGH